MRIGIDLGGTKTEGAVLDDYGSIRVRRRRATPTRDGYGAIIEAIASLVHELEAEVGRRCKVGIGTPGAISSRTGTWKNSNTLCLNGKTIDVDLERCLDREVRIENDANCFALSEAVDGAASAHRMVFGVILGTGVGGGIVFDKTLHKGPQGIAGEWGHNTLVPGGRLCYCGRRGCVETYLSGPGLLHDWNAARSATAEHLIAQADAGDERAKLLVAQFLDRFGRAMAMVINILDPDVIVLGGGLSNIEYLYTQGYERIAPHVFNDELRTILLRNQHGDSSGVRGAAQLWPVEPSHDLLRGSDGA